MQKENKKMGLPKAPKPLEPHGGKLGDGAKKLLEEEKTMVEKMVQEIQEVFNSKKPESAYDEYEFIKALMNSIGILEVTAELISEKFGIDIVDADMDFLYWVYYWETFVDGAEGGLFLGYSPKTGLYYYITGTIYSSTHYYSLKLHVLTEEKMKKWIKEGSLL